MRALVGALLVVGLFTAAGRSAGAQVHYETRPRPLVIANGEPWYQLGEPITFEGHFYFPSGPQVFFNTDRMVRTGAYRGIPLYADATLEPYSIVFVPLAGGLMHPYERRRTGDLAGSTGSRAPSFPVTIASESVGEVPGTWPRVPQAAAPPMLGTVTAAEPQVTSPEPAPVPAPGARAPEDPGVTGTAGAAPLPPPRRQLVQVGAKPRGLNEVFVQYQGFRWKSAGVAVELTPEFERVGEYHGYPVYVARHESERRPRIYLPSREGLVAPYVRAGGPVH